MVRSTRLLVVGVLMSLVLMTGCGSAEPQGSTEPQGGEATAPTEEASPGAALVEQKCSMCHNTDRVFSADYDQAKWTETVERMEKNGLVVTAEEKQQIINYLAEQDAAQ